MYSMIIDWETRGDTSKVEISIPWQHVQVVRFCNQLIYISDVRWS